MNLGSRGIACGCPSARGVSPREKPGAGEGPVRSTDRPPPGPFGARPATPELTRVAPSAPRLRHGDAEGSARPRRADIVVTLGALVVAAWAAVQVLDGPRSDLVLDPGGPKAPAVTFTTLDGRIVRLGSPEGAGLVLVFASTWCPSCAAEATAWNRAITWSGPIAVYVVDIDPLDTPESLAGFRDRYGLDNLRFVLDQQQAVARTLGFPGMDATIAVAGEGRIVYTDRGPTSQTTVDALIKALK